MKELPIHDSHLVPQREDQALLYFYDTGEEVEFTVAWLEGDTVKRKTFDESGWNE